MLLAQRVLNYLTIVLAAVVVSCLVSIMALFMGGGQASVDLLALMAIQIASIPASIVLTLLGLHICRIFTVGPLTVKRVYDAVPQWLLFIFMMLLLLVCSGEVAFLVVAGTTDIVVEWTAHAPLISMLTCSAAVCVLHGCAGLLAGRTLALSGRW